MKTRSAVMVAMMVAGAAGAYDLPAWLNDHGTVRAEWSDAWVGFSLGNDVSLPDTFLVKDLDGNVLTSVPGEDNPDAMKTSSTFHSDSPFNYMQITENWDLGFWIPSFVGETAQTGFIEISYYDDPGDASWRQGWSLGITPYFTSGSSVLAGPPVLVGTAHDLLNGVITEAYSFDLAGSARGLFVDLAADPGLSVGNPANLVDFSVATSSYSAIPEPSTMSLLAGALLVGLRARRMRFVRQVVEADR